MKKSIYLTFLVISIFIMAFSSSSLSAQRGGRGGGFSRGGFGAGFGGGYSRSFGGGGRSSFSVGVGPNRNISSIGRFNGGQRFLTRLPRSYQTIRFGGMPYYFYNGLFFNYYGGYYRSIFPPFGLSIGSLPYGYWGFNFGGLPYYYHSGVYYQQVENNYQVVQAPVGASVPQIPKDAKTVVVNNEKYYEYNGTYYKEYVKQDGTIWYLVAGLNGVLNTEVSDSTKVNNIAIPEVTIVKTIQYNVGDILDALPADCKAVVINNKKYYVSSNNIYFEEFIENNALRYKVVGK